MRVCHFKWFISLMNIYRSLITDTEFFILFERMRLKDIGRLLGLEAF